jgi:hypothetical protein
MWQALIGPVTNLVGGWMNNKYAIAINDIGVIDRVDAGFQALSQLPEWYQYLLFIAISSSFGIRGVSKLMELKK